MGSLSNLYISQSYTSLAHLGTDNALVPGQMTILQDGIGQSLNISFDGTNISSSGNIYAANLQGLASTSSFNAYTTSTNIRLNNLESTSASVNISITNLNTTTASLNTSVSELNSWSASAKVSISALNTYTASQSTASIVTSISNLNAFTASQIMQNATLGQVTSSILSFTASTNVSIANINNATQSLQGQLATIGLQSGSWITESETGSFLITASAVSNILTFTKGDNTQFNLTVGTDINTGSYLTTASFNAYTSSNNQRVSSLESNSASVNISISNLNTATASLFTSTSLSLITASFNTSSRNLTFTKGDNSTFSLNIPDITGSASTDTGSLLLNAQANGVNTIQFTRGDNTNFNVVLTVSSSAAAPQNTYTAIYSGSTWNVTHNLNTSTPLVFAYESGSQYTLPATLDIINPNQITLTWSRVVNGSLIVVNGGGGTSTYYGDVINTATASFTHNLDTLYPLVQFYESGSNAQAIPAGIVSTNVNTTTLYFSNLVSGKVVIKK
jgi:uncharacterized coiled-coil protein SlyX